MSKAVDNYILERKIGSGQFGAVFKGYNTLNNQDVAIKVVARSKLQGKMIELFENEIKVLRTCKNQNIIQLYDIKKTANNFYMVLEYCNEGDMEQKLKEKTFFTEDESIDYLLQIINGFKTLVKSNILHRDFKLPNLLLRDGYIKIADFGFSRLLNSNELANTMLGSPLNMAPEILQGHEYDNKVDIWSIGTVFYELLYGNPPYTAGNIADLIQNINKGQLVFPSEINDISEMTKDLIRKMLVVNPQKRISWEELFSHQIMNFFEEKTKSALQESLKDPLMGMSRFYIQNNMVIDHVSEIQKKKEVNQYAIQQNKNPQKQKFEGNYYNRKTSREETHQEFLPTEQGDMDFQNLESKEESMRETIIKNFKHISVRILHERNIYVFFASVAEECFKEFSQIDYFDISVNFIKQGFLITKKLVMTIQKIQLKLKSRLNIYAMKNWDEFTKTSDFVDIYNYICQELELFTNYFEKIHNQIKDKAPATFKELITKDFTKDNSKMYYKILSEYCRKLIKHATQNNKKLSEKEQKKIWVHIKKVLDTINSQQVFQFLDKNKKQFNFKQYYEQDQKVSLKDIVKQVETKLDQLNTL